MADIQLINRGVGPGGEFADYKSTSRLLGRPSNKPVAMNTVPLDSGRELAFGCMRVVCRRHAGRRHGYEPPSEGAGRASSELRLEEARMTRYDSGAEK